jgi:hypothetical protein
VGKIIVMPSAGSDRRCVTSATSPMQCISDNYGEPSAAEIAVMSTALALKP